MLSEKLSCRVSINANIRIQPQRLPAPELSRAFSKTESRRVTTVIFVGLVFVKSRRDKLLQRRRAPQHLREPRIVDLEPVVDAQCLVFLGRARCCG